MTRERHIPPGTLRSDACKLLADAMKPGGIEDFTMSGEAGAEQRRDALGFTVRGTMRVAI
jgi:hypothetical protein